MSTSLNQFKTIISQHDDLGPLPKTRQRIFHLGRELKTGGKSLGALGVGRFKIYTVHLLSQGGAPTANNKTSKHEKEDDQLVEVVGTKRKRNRVAAARARQSKTEVITLDTSDDDDDNDGVVEVVEPQSGSSRRRRSS